MYIACYNGHDKVVQVLLDHGVQMDVPGKVSDIWCIHVKLFNTTEVNEAILITKEISQKIMSIHCHCTAIVVIMVYQYTT